MPDAGVVDQHVEPAEALPVGLGQGLDVVLVGHVGRPGLDLEALRAEPLGGLLELVGPRAETVSP